MIKNDFNKNSFWTKEDPETGEKKYYLKMNNQFIEVDKDVYRVSYNSYRKVERDNKKDIKNGLISLDEDLFGKSLLDTYVESKEEGGDDIAQVLRIINSLDEKDRELITDLLIIGKTERELAKKFNVSQQMISKKKRRIIKKIKKIFDKGL